MVTQTAERAVRSEASSEIGRDVWVVIAAYREERRLAQTLSGLCAAYPNVVVVDDGSPDRTGEVAARHPVWVLRHPINCGQGAALQTGIDFALAQGASIVVTFDADGQHAVEDIDWLVGPVRRGEVDVVLGSRFLGGSVGMPWARWLVLKGGVLFTRLISRVRVTDTHNGFRALSRRAAEQIRITHDRMAHASEILNQIKQKGLSYREEPVVISYTEETLAKGQSSWNALKIVGQLLLGRIVR
jgi:glycosyltransferase involved in cell wall biosynthesis